MCEKWKNGFCELTANLAIVLYQRMESNFTGIKYMAKRDEGVAHKKIMEEYIQEKMGIKSTSEGQQDLVQLSCVEASRYLYKTCIELTLAGHSQIPMRAQAAGSSA